MEKEETELDNFGFRKSAGSNNYDEDIRYNARIASYSSSSSDDSEDERTNHRYSMTSGKSRKSGRSKRSNRRRSWSKFNVSYNLFMMHHKSEITLSSKQAWIKVPTSLNQNSAWGLTDHSLQLVSVVGMHLAVDEWELYIDLVLKCYTNITTRWRI